MRFILCNPPPLSPLTSKQNETMVSPLSVHAEYPCAAIVCQVLGVNSPSISRSHIHTSVCTDSLFPLFIASNTIRVPVIR